MRSKRQAGETGHAVIEVALMAPWIFLLFAAVLDFGFYSYAAIAVQNAARVAALRISEGSSLVGGVCGSGCIAANPNVTTLARTYVCSELVSMPNVGATCPTGVVQVAVPTQPFNGVDGQAATQVSVTYTTIPMIPLPFLTGQWTFTRIVQVKL